MSGAELGTQGRLTDALTDFVSCHGYARLAVERLLERAGVSRATFYQYFSSVEDCFLHAYGVQGERLVGEVARVHVQDGGQLALLGLLVAAAHERPEVANLLFREGLAAGPAGLRARERLIAGIERTAGITASAVALPTSVVIGAVMRFLAIHASNGTTPADLGDDIRRWLGCYEAPCGSVVWPRRLPPLSSKAHSTPPAGVRLRHPPAERIVRAAAASVEHRGYRATTVAHIVNVARVSRATFYNEFADRSAAVTAACERAFRETMAACAPEFFTVPGWTERVWQSSLAFTGYLAREPSFAHLLMAEPYALGPELASRVADSLLAFTFFLEGGNRQRGESGRLSDHCQLLIAASIAELAMLACRGQPGVDMRRIQPLAVYMTLAPFVGVHEAARLVTRKLDGPH